MSKLPYPRFPELIAPFPRLPKHVYKLEVVMQKVFNKTVELPDNDAVRGMVWHVKHLVKVEEI